MKKIIEEIKTNALKMTQVHHITKAFECLETAMDWLEQQKNTDPIQLTYLRRIRDMAALERMSSLKQATIESFFA